MKRKISVSAGCITAAAAMILCAAACAKNYTTAYHDITFWIDVSHHEILVGEKVTASARSTNTAGHEVDIVWQSTGGEVEVIQDGRAVRVMYESMGVYRIKAKLYVDDRLIDMDTVSITVKPLS